VRLGIGRVGREKHCETGMRRHDPGGEKALKILAFHVFLGSIIDGVGATTLRKGHTCGHART